MSNLQTAYDYFISQGDSQAASAGIAAGLYAESQVNPSIVNPTSGAFGIGQWLSSRLIALEDMFGSSPSLQNQLQFVQSELTGSAGTGNQGGGTILADTTPQQALSDFITKFERPAAGSETTGDISRGTTALASLNMSASPSSPTGNFGLGVQAFASDPWGSLGTAITNIATNPLGVGLAGAQASAGLAGQGANQVTGNIAAQVAAGVAAGTKPVTDWLSGLTSGDTVTRVSVGIIAVVLLAAGIFFLAGNKSMTLNVASLKGAVA